MFTPSASNRRSTAPRKRVENRTERKPVTKAATICIDGADMVMPCTIRDIHGQGARMSVGNMALVPDVFLMISRSEDMVARAKVAWRKNNEIGVRFMRKGALYEEARFRKEQNASYLQDLAAKERQRKLREEALAAQRAEEEQREEQARQYRAHLMQLIGMDITEPLDEAALKAAYRREAMRRHPDQGGSMEAFQELNGIYQYLMAYIAPPQPQVQAIAL